MAVTGLPQPPQVHRIPQSKYIDGVRWLPPVSAFDRYAVLAFFDSDCDYSSVEIHSVKKSPSSILTPTSTWDSPSRISSLKTSQSRNKTIVVASTFNGSLHVLLTNPMEASFESELSVSDNTLHAGPVACVDVMDGGVECLSVDEDGRVNLVSIGDSGLNYKPFFDSNGLVSYTAAKWASPSEFVTGGYGFSLQWWDQRKPGGAVSQFKGKCAEGPSSGIVHSIDIHPSRKHTCLAGGSAGTTFAWDLRWQQQPIVLSGVGVGDAMTRPPSESDIWEVQYDICTKSSNIGVSSSRILPVMICSEDGIIAVIEQGEQSLELLAEPCAINGFDIDRQNPSDVICSLEWEYIAIISRP